MNQQPEIILSSLDVQRIEALIEKSPALANQTEKLETELARGTIVEPTEMPANVVTMNSRVRFRMVKAGKEFEKTLCYPKDLATTDSGISIFAPIGSALLGLQTGQRIQWPLQNSTQHVEIIEILYQPERDKNYAA